MVHDKGFEIIISSDIQYEKLCAEIYYDMEFVAIISQENEIENAVIEIYPPKNMANWTFKYSEFLAILNKAYESII